MSHNIIHCDTPNLSTPFRIAILPTLLTIYYTINYTLLMPIRHKSNKTYTYARTANDLGSDSDAIRPHHHYPAKRYRHVMPNNKITIHPFLGTLYIALGTLDGLHYVHIASSHTLAMQGLFVKHRINTNK